MNFTLSRITHKPLFWIAFLLISIIGCYFSYTFFSKAFPIVNLTITMDRDDALKKAREISAKNSWPTSQFRQAASFGVDETIKNYTELEAGGVSAFKQIISTNFFSPYAWTVRQFKENNIHETYIYFSPEGKPLGYRRNIPEDNPGAALSEKDALALGQAAVKNWPYNLTDFKLISSSHKKQKSGRIDYNFAYQAQHKKIGDAPYRLKIKVKGDAVSDIYLKVKIPDSFKKKYQEMRSYNETLAAMATFILYFFFFIFILGGIIYLLKKRMLLWKPALIWGAIIAFFESFGSLNELPINWLLYNTANSEKVFLFQQFISFFYQFLWFFGIGSLVIMAAEGLSRLAFGHHIQLWKFWRNPAPSTFQVAGRTVAGYLFVGFKITYAILLYYATSRYLGWWDPASSLFDPDSLATYLPWFSPIGKSLGAGFLEECIFRIAPLSAAAIIGKKFGKKNWWIGGMFLLQAIVFAAAHANYPAQPFYARLVELILPSFFFATIFLFFGMAISIITHFVYDVVWFSLPVMISHAPGMWFDKLMIILLAGIPLIIVCYYWIKNKNLTQLAINFYNHAWQPKTGKFSTNNSPTEDTPSKQYPLPLFAGSAIIGLVAWIALSSFTPESLPLKLDRESAITQAYQAIANDKNFIDDEKKWTTQAMIIDPMNLITPYTKEPIKEQYLYAWRNLSQEVYHSLLKTNLLPPAWLVRFIRYNGSIDDRSEEYQITIADTGSAYRINHMIPENQAGKHISQKEAETLVHQRLLTNKDEIYTLAAATSKKKPERTDWLLTYTAPSSSLKKAENRLHVTVSGDKVTDWYSYLSTPEEWNRSFLGEQQLIQLLSVFKSMLLLLLLALLAFLCLASNLPIHFSRKSAGIIAAILTIRLPLQYWNLWPQYTGYFNTIEPYAHQVFTLLAAIIQGNIISILLYSALGGIVMGTSMRSQQQYRSLKSILVVGLGVGCMLLGIGASITLLINNYYPLWPNFIPAGGIIPSISPTLYNIRLYFEQTIIYLCALLLIDHASQGWKKNKTPITLLTIGIIFCLTPLTTTISSWFIASCELSLITIIGYVYILRTAKAALPIIVAIIFSMHALQEAFFHAYPGSFTGQLITAGILITIGIIWSNAILPQSSTQKGDL